MDKQQLLELQQKYDAEQRIEEIEWFYRAVERLYPEVIVEIGIKEGGNLKILSTHLNDNGVAIGIDPRQDIPWKMNDCLCKAYHIKGNSHQEETKKELIKILDNRPIDVLFIDGDHSFSGMILDYKDYSPLVRIGGIIAVHDIYYLPDVAAAWEEISKGENQKFVCENIVTSTIYIQSSIGIGYIIKE